MKTWRRIRFGLFTLLGLSYILFENVIGTRLYVLIFLVLTLMGVTFVKRKNYWYLIDIICVFFLSLLSRYVINYFVYVWMMLIMVELGLQKPNRWMKVGLASIIVMSLYNFGVLFYYKRTFGVLSEILFILVIQGLILMCLFLLHQNKMEKEKQQSLNEQLESLTQIAVKNEIARDIHDTFGHDMMALIMELEMAHVYIDKDIEAAKKLILNAKTSARDGMKTIRKVVETLRNDALLVDETIENMIDRFKSRVGIEVTYTSDVIWLDHLDAKAVLYPIIKEAMTNSVRHGQATKIIISVKKGLKTITFSIRDNGHVHEVIHEGFGLKGMRERVEALNGQLKIETEDGFHLSGYVET